MNGNTTSSQVHHAALAVEALAKSPKGSGVYLAETEIKPIANAPHVEPLPGPDPIADFNVC
jgi:hypothetical protein